MLLSLKPLRRALFTDYLCVTGCLVYFLPEGEDTTIGADRACKIVLSGLGMQPFMCRSGHLTGRILS